MATPGFSAESSLYQSSLHYATLASADMSGEDVSPSLSRGASGIGPIRCPAGQKCCGTYDDRGCNGDCCPTTGPGAGTCCADLTCCPHPNVCCGGTCVAPATFQTDVNNCGSCGHVCPGSPGGSFCCDGLCVSCPSGQPGWVIKDTTPGQCRCECNCSALAPPGANCNCGGVCKDLLSDPDNCGACGHRIPAGGVWKCCDGTPTDVMDDDPLNCGDCGYSANAGVCLNLKACCTPPNEWCCSGTCVDLTSDTDNCGVCGHSCRRGTCRGTCVNSTCVCPPLPCKKCNGDCVDTSIDQLNCGDCDNRCFPGESCCSGECACNCTTGEKCSPIETCCNGAYCANLQIDNTDCGGCGKPCRVAVAYNPGCGTTYGQCAGGQCTCGIEGNFTGNTAFGVPTCCPPLTPTWCRSNAGCFCVNTNTDANNCGKCGIACVYQAPGEPDVPGRCDQGACKCPQGWPVCEVDSRGDDIVCCDPGYECQSSKNTCCPPGTSECTDPNTGKAECCPPGTSCCTNACCTPPLVCGSDGFCHCPPEAPQPCGDRCFPAEAICCAPDNTFPWWHGCSPGACCCEDPLLCEAGCGDPQNPNTPCVPSARAPIHSGRGSTKSEGRKTLRKVARG
jgi:hypothetical protein